MGFQKVVIPQGSYEGLEYKENVIACTTLLEALRASVDLTDTGDALSLNGLKNKKRRYKKQQTSEGIKNTLVERQERNDEVNEEMIGTYYDMYGEDE
jgi:hypothetical protein